MGNAPAPTTEFTSAGVKSPSGPTHTVMLLGFRFRSSMNSLKNVRGCFAPGCNDAMSVRSARSAVARYCAGFTGSTNFGSHVEPHCLIASMPIQRHFSTFDSDRSSSRCATVLSDIIGTTFHAPNSAAFCTMISIALPLGTAWTSVNWQGRGGIAFR